jgi:signal transduction histidine kinase
MAPEPTNEELEFGIPLFLDQLIKTLEVEETRDAVRSVEVSGSAGGLRPNLSEIGDSAVLHGRELMKHGFTVDQVVHDYGDLCQAITGLAFDKNVPIEIDEFRTLNRCLDNGIAEAVTEFSHQRDLVAEDKQTEALQEQLGFFAHELRNLVCSATLALSALRSGNVGFSGATGAVLEASLVGLNNLADRSLTEVRLAAGLRIKRRLFSLAQFIADVKLAASLEADTQGCGLGVSGVDPTLAVEADRDLLFSAVGNLLQNGFKYTKPKTKVTLSAYTAEDRILIEVADHCGGLPPGGEEKMFRPFVQGDESKGLGLGLSIAQRSVEANEGTLSVRNVPGTGCVFTINLPRETVPERPVRW